MALKEEERKKRLNRKYDSNDRVSGVEMTFGDRGARFKKSINLPKKSTVNQSI